MTRAAPIATNAGWMFVVLAVLGAVLPLRYLVRFLFREGLNVSLFFHQLFQYDIPAFFAMDVFLSALTLLLFVFIEGRRRRMNALWVYVLCTMLVGVSFALPLFLYFRERHE